MNIKRLNTIYRNMKTRCYNRNDVNYLRYGGRGITICDEWIDKRLCGERNLTKGWLAFKDWALSNGYTDELTIDRIDNNKGYSPENCQWVSRKIQSNNTRRNHFLTYNGKCQTIAQWCEELGLDYDTVQRRISTQHWSVEKAFNTPRKHLTRRKHLVPNTSRDSTQ